MKVLQFSGGADSLATLFVKRREWDDILVMWCNTGAAYPDTIEYMDRIRNLVPHFEEVKSDKPAWESINGTAVDLVPADRTVLGQAITGNLDSHRFIDYLQCCSANIWWPLHLRTAALGIKHIIRGQRNGEYRKAPIASGHKDDNGITYEFPIQEWSKERVFAFCRAACPEWLPPYYAKGELTSHDCWDCIAYRDENQKRLSNLQHDQRLIVSQKVDNHLAAVKEMTNILEATHVY